MVAGEQPVNKQYARMRELEVTEIKVERRLNEPACRSAIPYIQTTFN